MTHVQDGVRVSGLHRRYLHEAGTAPGQVIAADCAVGCQPFEGRAGCTPRVVAVGVRGRHVGIGGQVGQRIEGQVG